ncbi:MAG: hypothetical protein WCD18_22430 [Thermosynechococcaceae cyanobacterium]
MQLHYAIQSIAAVGAALAEPLPDGSHVSLSWNPTLEVFMGAPIRAETPFRVVLDPISLTAGLINQHNRIFASQSLHRKTLTEALDWHKSELTRLGVNTSGIQLLTYPPDFPDHPLGHGDRFDTHQHIAERWELTLYYANTFHFLQEAIAEAADATPIHIWPHHFDMATLLYLPGQRNGEPITIGIGLSPGDTSYAEPYWYVSPYPYPSTAQLPELDGNGLWHTQDWVGAVLTTSNLVADSSQAQQEQIQSFLESARLAAQSLLQEAQP